MYLKRLEIHGFKSFASKTVMEFEPGIIAIVGPNGSGKSNVADCLRWVLGEQSAKIIRGKSSQDVIFAGSDKKTKLGFAEVFATFDNRDRRIPVDASEVSIGRRIDRSGESDYLINGNRVRLLDIVDLVLKSNIGTSRYTVIGQGTIDQMILAGPSEIKNLLDEASGVKTYYIKREKTMRRLEQTAQNLMRAADLIAEIEPRLKNLRRQAKKMEARAEIETELKKLQREYFGKTYWDLSDILSQYRQKLDEAAARRSQAEAELAATRASAENLENGSQEHTVKFRALQETLGKLQNQKNKFLEDLSLVRGKMQGQRTANVGDEKSLQVEVHNKGRKILEIKEKISHTASEQSSLTGQLTGQKKLLDELTVKLNSLYANSKSPIQIDWSLFDLELKSLDTIFNDFCQKALSSDNLQEIRQSTEHLQLSFAKFKNVAKETLRNPEETMAAFQHELEAVLRQKEAMASQVAGMELNLSKSKFSLEFLEKELAATEQEKLHLDLELKKAQSTTPDEFWNDLLAEELRIKQHVGMLAEEVLKLEHELKSYYDSEDARQKQLKRIEQEYRQHQEVLSHIKDQESGINIEKAKFDTQMEVLAEEIMRMLGETVWGEIRSHRIESTTPGLGEKISRMKNQLDMIGGIDELTLQEYQETEARYTNLSGQITDLKQGMADLRNIIDELDEHIKAKFNESFHKINEKFEGYFRMLFNGGRAYLSVLKSDEEVQQALDGAGNGEEPDQAPSDALRPEERIIKKYEKGPNTIIGIDIKATPPNKKLSSIQALSGGERALTSIALLCSLLACFPSPFVVLDEVDAALDDANTIRFGQILGTLSHQTQFITITHNRETMAQASMLYGVTMGDDGISKLLSVKLEQAKQFAK